MKILVTGGSGYIGSHTVLELLEAGHTVTVVDNLSNSSSESLSRVQKLTGKAIVFQKVDILDTDALSRIFSIGDFDAVIHFAALKAVGESVANPLAYYNNNIKGILVLYDLIRKHGVNRLVFSSSAAVYGVAQDLPVHEDMPLSAVNPYGWTKLMAEQILRDCQYADRSLSIALLRYFNPVGAHPSGLIGEDPSGTPSNLFPYIAQVASGRRKKLKIYGGDYDTPDGTGIRDYIHVVDLARGHVKALEAMQKPGKMITLNLGTGCGYSVLQVINAFEQASGQNIPFEIVDRRPGDIAESYADVRRAAEVINWKTQFSLPEMCRDSWNWQSKNPLGYGS